MPVAMTEVDERQFLAFLRETADIRLILSFAPTKEELFVSEFAPRQKGHWSYNIWNTAFDWKMKYKQVRDGVPESQNPGWYYISDTSAAPLIEYTRHRFDDAKGAAYGRIYWAKFFAAGPLEIDYDVGNFSKWYDTVVRWIRKNGTKKLCRGVETYFLPDALTM